MRQQSCSIHSFKFSAGEQQAASSTAAPSPRQELYYGTLIPKHMNSKQRFNFRRKIRNNLKEGLKAREGLAGAGAPETAAAVPNEELPQNSKAAQHQREYIARLEDAERRNRDASARKAAAREEEERTEGQLQQGTAATAASASSTAEPQAQTGAASASSEPSADPSAPNWRVQQKQWVASQTPRATTSSAGIDLLQASTQQAQPQQVRRPGFQGKAPGRPRPHTPYGASPAPQAESQQELEPELTEEEKQQEEEAIMAAIRYAAFLFFVKGAKWLMRSRLHMCRLDLIIHSCCLQLALCNCEARAQK